MKVKVLQNQTIFDIALEYLGSLDYLCNIIRDNNIGITYDISGMELDVYPENIGNEIDKKFLKGFSCCNKYELNLNAPTNLEIVGLTETHVNLSWVDNSDIEQGFKIEQSIEGEIHYIEMGQTTLSTYSLPIDLSGMIFIRVRAFTGNVNSSYSNTVNYEI